MSTFEQLYCPGGDVDDALRPLMRRLHDALQRTPMDLPQLRASLISVLEYLASSIGRTDANCSAVNSFLILDETWNDDRIPQAYIDVLADMTGALHDTISAPEIAANFESTPEQLLVRARHL